MRGSDVTLLAAVASFVVALYWVAQYARLARHKMLGKANGPEKTAGEDRSGADRAAQDAGQGAPQAGRPDCSPADSTQRPQQEPEARTATAGADIQGQRGADRG
jgi:hypothetical protein